MATNYAMRLANLLPDVVTDMIKRRVVSKGASRHKIILEYISGSDDVLDIGCVRHSLDSINWENPEPGEWLHAEIREQSNSTVGIDTEESEVKKLKKEGLDVIVGNAETFELEKSFDIIVAGELIEHLSNPGLFLQRCHNHLRANGKLVISTPNPRRLQMLYWFSTGHQSRANPEHTMWFDPYVMEELIERHGFKMKEWNYYNPSISLISTPLFAGNILQPITSGGFVFVLEPN